MVRHVLDQFVAADIHEVVLAAKEDDYPLREYMRQQEDFSSVTYVNTTERSGTGGAVRALLKAVDGSPCVLSTVDTVGPPDMTANLLRFARMQGASVQCVVVTSRLIEDDNPVWVISDAQNYVRRFGKGSPVGSRVFGNVRWFSAEASRRVPTIEVPESEFRDSVIMTELIERWPDSVVAFEVDPVFDIDDPTTLEAAESWLAAR